MRAFLSSFLREDLRDEIALIAGDFERRGKASL